MTTPHKFGDVIHWSTIPFDMTVRTGDSMVHRVFELVGSSVRADEVVLECGVRAPRSAATNTTDPVDCMACMIYRTSEAMEAEWVECNETIRLKINDSIIV